MFTDALITLKDSLLDLPYMYYRSSIIQSDFYLHRDHFNAVKSLRNDDSIVISKPDKRTRVVILNRCDYVNKMANIFRETFKFIG